MSIVIFCGPTVSAEEGRELLDATFLPPVGQGDVYRATRASPCAIGIIDGTFERSPAVWHKEILWALSQGIHVFGSASMGALRAAELAAFGMQGVGVVFDWYRNGTIEDDDEVAVAHAGAAHGYRASSEAMVNIRSTLQSAVRNGVLRESAAEVLCGLAKGLFYPERSYPLLLQAARKAGVDEPTLEAFSRFIEHGRINQKKEDALAMLRRMNEERPVLARTKKNVEFEFEHTDTWDQVVGSADMARADSFRERAPTNALPLAEELRLRGRNIVAVRRGMMLRALAEREARRTGFAVTPELRDFTSQIFRRGRGLEATEATLAWLGRHRLSEAEFGRFLEEEARLRWFETLYQSDSARHLVDELIASGDFESVHARAMHKEEVLRARGLHDPDLKDADIDIPTLLAWYFQERLKVPAPADFTAHLREVGLRSPQELVREALREYLYLTLGK